MVIDYKKLGFKDKKEWDNNKGGLLKTVLSLQVQDAVADLGDEAGNLDTLDKKLDEILVEYYNLINMIDDYYDAECGNEDEHEDHE